MEKITINLLPEEFKLEEFKKARFYKIQALGTAVILTMMFLSSLTIGLRILQSQSISNIQKKLSEQEQRITELKDTQASLFLVKNRLTSIDQYLGNPSKQSQMYSLINQLLPNTLSINSVSVDRSGNISVLATTGDISSLDSLINRIITDEDTRSQIGKVSLENLNEGLDGIFRVSLRIIPK